MNTKTRVCVCLFVAILCVPDLSFSRQDADDESPTTAELVSIANCRVQNARGLVSGDVVITIEDFFDNVEPSLSKGVLVRNKREIRVVFDSSADWFSHYAIETQEVVDISSEEVDRQNFQHVGFCYAGGDAPVFSRIKDDLTVRSQNNYGDSLLDVLKGVSFPDPRGLILSGSLGVHKTMFQSSLQTMPSAKDKIKNVKSAKQVGDRILLVKHIPNSGVEGFSLRVSETYELTSLMLRSRTIKLHHSEKEQEIPFESIKFQWKDYDGIQVPTKVTSEKNLTMNVGGRRESGTKVVNIFLDWLSVNQPVPDDFFDGSLLKSEALVREQVEVAKQKAVQITEKEKSQ